MKILFIAMSGVRVQDEELLKEGLTLPGFVERSKVIASLPSLGLLTLAGCTPDEFQKQYLDVQEIKHLENFPLDADLVVISSFNGSNLRSL